MPIKIKTASKEKSPAPGAVERVHKCVKWCKKKEFYKSADIELQRH